MSQNYNKKIEIRKRRLPNRLAHKEAKARLQHLDHNPTVYKREMKKLQAALLHKYLPSASDIASQETSWSDVEYQFSVIPFLI